MRISDWSSDVCSSDLAFENGGDAGARLRSDLAGGVVERQPEAFGQPPADRRLARAHRADEDEVGCRIHGRMLAPHAAALTRPGLACALRRRCRPHWRSAMTVAKVIEVNASSEKSVEDAVRHGLKKTSETVKGIKGVWVNEIKAVTNDTGDITEWRVNLRITFVVG